MTFREKLQMECHEKIKENYGGGCLVTYKFIFKPRLKALFCRYYKAKEV